MESRRDKDIKQRNEDLRQRKDLKSLAESQKRIADIAEWFAKQRGMIEHGD